MNSPIKTVITNKLNVPFTITCIPRRRVVINPKGCCTILGDVFSQCENSRSISTLLGHVVNGSIHIHYVVDGAFEVKSEGAIMEMPASTRKHVSDNKVLLKDATVEPVEDDKKQEESKKDSDEGEAADDEVKLENLNLSDEPKKVEEAIKQEPAEELKPAEEPKPEEELKEKEAEKAPATAKTKVAEKAKASKSIQVK